MKMREVKSALVFPALVLAVFLCFRPAEAAGWFQPVLGLSRVNITVDRNMVAGQADLEDFPVYLDLSGMPSEFFEKVREDGGDIRITAADGVSEIPREVVSMDRAEKSGEVHFRGTLHHDKDTVFFVYFGNPGLPDHAGGAPYGHQNVWTDNYVSVWHKNDFDMARVIDSRSGNSGVKASSDNPAEVQGKLGYAQEYDGETASISAPVAAGFDSFTISAWLKAGDMGGTAERSFMYMRAGDTHLRFGIHPATDRIVVRWRDVEGGYTNYRLSRTRLAANRWFFITLTYDGQAGVLKGYVNGELEETHEDVTIFAQPTGPVDFGYDRVNRRYYTGVMDEIRLSGIARGGGWIKTEYNNQNSPSRFISVGGVESAG